jgi:hypothetical protein
VSTMLDMPAKPQNRSGVPVGLRLPPDLMARIKRFRESLRPQPSITAVFVDALVEYLDRREQPKSGKR